MSDSVISLRPTMQKRLLFDHPLMDGVDDYKMSREDTIPAIHRYLANRIADNRDDLVMGYLWIVKDLVCRFRFYFPQVHTMTDDLVSEGILGLTDFVEKIKKPLSQQKFFEKCQWWVHSRMRDHINNYRSIATSSPRTNYRREANGEDTTYIYASEYRDDLNGEADYDPCYVDILDSIEALAETDHEEMRTLIAHFLQENHNIDEDSLSPSELEALDKLSEIGKNLL